MRRACSIRHLRLWRVLGVDIGRLVGLGVGRVREKWRHGVQNLCRFFLGIGEGWGVNWRVPTRRGLESTNVRGTWTLPERKTTNEASPQSHRDEALNRNYAHELGVERARQKLSHSAFLCRNRTQESLAASLRPAGNCSIAGSRPLPRNHNVFCRNGALRVTASPNPVASCVYIDLHRTWRLKPGDYIRVVCPFHIDIVL